MHCFHCGLPTQRNVSEHLSVLGKDRYFCCHGCKAVCKTIIDSGLEDYYRTRDNNSLPSQKSNLQELLDKLSIYDDQNVQKSFVQRHENWREAYLILEGIRCSACVWLNELQLRKQQGVIDVHIDEVTQRARVRWDPDQISLSKILAAIVMIGYQAHPYEPSHYQQLQRENKRKNTERLIFAAFIGMIPMHFALATWFIGGPDARGQLANWEILGRWTSLFVTLSILVYPAQEFFYGVWSDLRRRVIGMDVPIVLGLCSAFFLSMYSTITASGEVYFESISMFVLFILLSRRLEHQAKIKASDQLERLALNQPQEASLIVDNNEIRRVSVSDINPGDKIRILPGEQVPVDCHIIQGQSSFDESLLSGESLPVEHKPGDRIIAGSVNYNQAVIASALNDEMSSTIVEISRLAEAGLQKKPDQAILADRIASGFVSIILLIALVSGVFWWLNGNDQWLVISISILIVTCPCALALATPIALTISSSLALKMGVLAVNMSVFDKLTSIDVFAFDKTGTLTQGEPQLVEYHWFCDNGKDKAQSVLRSLVESSEHPLARAVKSHVQVEKMDMGDVKNHVGLGLEAIYREEIWRYGSPEFACQEIDLDSLPESGRIRSLLNSAFSISCLSRGPNLVAILQFEDMPRQGVQPAISGLHKLGIQPVILSGDSESGVKKIATGLGIEHYQSRLTPAMKMSWVQQQQSQGNTVAMIGDGINDAPTLACADVSFSLSESTGLANLHSDFIVLGSDLSVLPRMLELATNTRRKIRQNLGWAILYNILAIPFAVAGLVPPWLAAIGMSVSSIIVIYNSMRLQANLTDLGQETERDSGIFSLN